MVWAITIHTLTTRFFIAAIYGIAHGTILGIRHGTRGAALGIIMVITTIFTEQIITTKITAIIIMEAATVLAVPQVFTVVHIMLPTHTILLQAAMAVL